MKKILTLFLCALLLGSSLLACTGTAPAVPEANRLRIVTTIFPLYDWVRQILGERADAVELSMLLDSGVDLHSFQPTADDIVRIASCDLFLYVGGESDEWVEDALNGVEHADRIVINLLDMLGDAAKEEAHVEGMQAETDGALDEDAHEHEAEYDEHVWLSLKNAAVLCEKIAQALGQKDPAHRDVYAANASAYVERLNALDREFASTVQAAKQKTLLFGDRFPFRYLCDDYGLSYYAAFAGCSAETEASFETVIFLAEKVDALRLGAILQLEGSDGALPRTIRDATAAKDQKLLTMDSLQSVTAADVQGGATYLSLMERNLATLKEALE